jgi:hypothetical protein
LVGYSLVTLHKYSRRLLYEHMPHVSESLCLSI